MSCLYVKSVMHEDKAEEDCWKEGDGLQERLVRIDSVSKYNVEQEIKLDCLLE